MSNPDKKTLTLCVIYRKDKVLLGMKKRGFGAGRWNGFGGKVHKGESIEDAAIRELHEEAGVTPRALMARGTLTFQFQNDPVKLMVHLFSANEFEGEPIESEEMKPQWFSYDAIPYDTMWPDDRLWLPQVLEGKNIQGKFFFKDPDTLLSHSLKTY